MHAAYTSIGQFYDALLAGIEIVEKTDPFAWSTKHQRDQLGWTFNGPAFNQVIANLSDAKRAIGIINDQGEGHTSKKVSPPFTPEDFPVAPQDILNGIDEGPGNNISHYGRLIRVLEDPKGLPLTYQGAASPSHPANVHLQETFQTVLDSMKTAWADPSQPISGMMDVRQAVLSCWQQGVLPHWTPPHHYGPN